MSNLKKKLSRAYEDFGHFFEPFAILVGITVVALPIIAVINLSVQTPKYKLISHNTQFNNDQNEDVLGVTEEANEIELKLISGQHNVIQDESLNFRGDNNAIFSATLLPRDSGNFSKPVVTAINNSSESKVIKIVLNEYNGESFLSLIYLDQNRYLYTPKYGSEIIEMTLSPNSSQLIYLNVFNRETINYPSLVEFQVTY